MLEIMVTGWLFMVVVRVAGMRYWWTMLLGEDDLVTKEDMRNLGRAAPWLTVQQGCIPLACGNDLLRNFKSENEVWESGGA